MVRIVEHISRIGRTATGVWIAVLFAVALLAAPVPARAACFNGAQARAIVAQNGLVPLGQVVSGFRNDGAQVTGARLCTGGGGYVYRLTLVTPNGRVRRVSVNAHTGY